MPSALRAAVRQRLRDDALPQLRSWALAIAASQTFGSASLTFTYDEPNDLIVRMESDRRDNGRDR